jgi:Domain of unknown function (DUF6457)
MPDVLTTWITELAAQLGVDPAHLDRTLLLDVARDAAHGVARPAAPLTTFLVGYAAGLRGGGPEAVAAAAAVAQRLAVAHAPSPDEAPPGS